MSSQIDAPENYSSSNQEEINNYQANYIYGEYQRGQNGEKDNGNKENSNSINQQSIPPNNNILTFHKTEPSINKQPQSQNKTIQKRKKNQKKFDFSKFDYHSIEYNIEKEITRIPIDIETPFMERMQRDIIQRQSKSARRERIITSKKVKKSEKERLEGFNRLIIDANRRLEINENMETANPQLMNKNYNYKKMPSNKWNQIYRKRFASFTVKLENQLKKKIIQKEKDSKNKEDKIVENINKHIKKASKEQVNKIVNRLWAQSQAKKAAEIVKEREDNGVVSPPKKPDNISEKPKTVISPQTYRGNKRKSLNINRFLFSNSNTNQNKTEKKNKPSKSLRKSSLSLMKKKIELEDELSFLQLKTSVNAEKDTYMNTNYLNTDTFRKRKYCKSENESNKSLTLVSKTHKTTSSNAKYISDHFASKLVNKIFKFIK